MKSNSNQLVCQHLEGISRRALEDHQDIIRQFVRRRHGIYALYKKNRLTYVGLATNLRSRLSHHLRDRHAHTWNRFSVYLTVGDDKLKELESLVLRIANPKDNRQGGKFARSEDLRKIFRRHIAQKQREELDNIFDEEKKESKPKEKKQRKTVGRTPVLSKFIERGFRIRMEHKGKTYSGRVRRDGTIRVKGKKFTSPSIAAAATAKHSMNGWTKWKFERSPGEWVFLDTLRK